LKIKTLKDNVMFFRDKKGSEHEVSDSHGKFLIKKGSAEEVKAKKEQPKKQEPKKEAPKKEPKKTTKKDGE
jgi:hypothetical protein